MPVGRSISFRKVLKLFSPSSGPDLFWVSLSFRRPSPCVKWPDREGSSRCYINNTYFYSPRRLLGVALKQRYNITSQELWQEEGGRVLGNLTVFWLSMEILKHCAEITKIFLCITHIAKHNYISPSSTVGILHVSALHVGHLQVVIWLTEQLYKMCGLFFLEYWGLGGGNEVSLFQLWVPWPRAVITALGHGTHVFCMDHGRKSHYFPIRS